MASSSDTTRTSAQIEADLGATRDRLTSAVEALIDQVHPNRIKQRTIANIKEQIRGGVDTVRSQFFNTRGDLRKDRIGALAGAAAGLISFVLVVKAIRNRGRRG